jgi:hypothetical protein
MANTTIRRTQDGGDLEPLGQYSLHVKKMLLTFRAIPSLELSGAMRGLFYKVRYTMNTFL